MLCCVTSWQPNYDYSVGPQKKDCDDTVRKKVKCIRRMANVSTGLVDTRPVLRA